MIRLKDDFKDTPWKAISHSQLERASRVPTMLSHEECQLYYWLTHSWMRDIGAVVDLGCFVGGSTARLAAGLADAGKRAEVHAFDRFRASQELKEKLLYAKGVAPFEGPKTLPTAIELLAPWTDRIALYPGRIEKKIWEDGPIEILVLDASKSAVSMDAMNAIFMPHLVPGQSLVVQQDYYHWRLPWIAAQMARMKDWFTPVAFGAPDTMVFLNTRQIDAEALEIGQMSEVSDRDLMALLDDASETVAPWGQDARLHITKNCVMANPGIRRAPDMRWPRPTGA